MKRKALRFDIIAIAASAGGIPVLCKIVENLSPDLSSTVIVVQHLSRSVKSNLVQILRRSTLLPVTWASDGQCFEGGTIYVAPPNSSLRVTNARRFDVRKCASRSVVSPAADPLFLSVASYFGSDAIAIVLTGALWDGAAGVAALKACGATILIQDPATAVARGMPDAAIRTKGTHFVLPIEMISYAIVALTSVPSVVPILRQNNPLRYWLKYRRHDPVDN
jgi:two-component system chemotaxis response regulator CheB